MRLTCVTKSSLVGRMTRDFKLATLPVHASDFSDVQLFPTRMLYMYSMLFW